MIGQTSASDPARALGAFESPENIERLKALLDHPADDVVRTPLQAPDMNPATTRRGSGRS